MGYFFVSFLCEDKSDIICRFSRVVSLIFYLIRALCLPTALNQTGANTGQYFVDGLKLIKYTKKQTTFLGINKLLQKLTCKML